MKKLIALLLVLLFANAEAATTGVLSSNAPGVLQTSNGGFGTQNNSLLGTNNNALQLDPSYVPANTTIKIVGPLHLYADATSLTYALTATPAAPTGSAALVLTSPGTYVLSAVVSTAFSGATFAAPQAVTCYLYRTNNTAVAITDSTSTALTPILTTTTLTGPSLLTNNISYTTSNSTDSLSIYCSISVVPAAGSLQVTATHISAVRIN